MEILLIKDSRGKDLLVFNKENINEYTEMGDKVDDFEILQVLGQGSFGFVAKVKSRLNHKIYAMKQIDFTTLEDKKLIDLSINETKLLSNLNNSLIIKYYKSIKEGQTLYIIMEFMDNGDLGGMLKANKTLEKPIREEKLFDIFIQAMKSLAYIHSKKIVHRDIKPENLFISVDGCVKLGDFGVSAAVVDKNEKNKNYQYLNNYKNQNNNNFKNSVIGDVICQQTIVGTPPFMSPEMLNESEYDLKTDVYSMGVTFFEICFWHLPRVPSISFTGDIKLVDVPIKNNVDVYSKELVDIINKMIEIDKNKRPSSEQILNLLESEFNKKYAKNSSIGSVLSCLYAYEEFTEYLKKPSHQNFINNNSNQKPISFAYLYGINAISNNINEDWNNSLCKIRNVLTNENNRYSGNKEIETRHILYYLLGRMHKELNLKNLGFVTMNSTYIEDFNKNDALLKYLNYTKNNNKSPIFDYFYGFMKTKSVCSKCKIANYSFNNFFYVSFNINLAKKKANNNLSLEELFNIQNKICVTLDINSNKFCTKCNSVQVYFQLKQFYSFPHFLIVCLDRGNNSQNNNVKISYNMNLDLKKQCELQSPTYFNLIGIIKKLDKGENEHYIALYYDYNIKSWVLRDDSTLTKINSPMDHKQGIEMVFFYKEDYSKSISNNNVTSKHSSKSIGSSN